MKEVDVYVTLKSSPVLLDAVLQSIQERLLRDLSWLDYAFGKAYNIVDTRIEASAKAFPAAYVGNGEYVSLLPNDNLGNFSWFDIYDPQEITETIRALPQYSFKGALIFWYDLKSIYPDNSVIYTEEVKNQVIQSLTSPGLLKNGRFTINRVYERLENIYQGYSIEKIEDSRQFFMYPYAGLRIEFTINTKELCGKYT